MCIEQAKKHWYLLIVCLLGAFNTSYADCQIDLDSFCCPEKCCPIANPICPPCDLENTVNCAVVTKNKDDGSEGTLSFAVMLANMSCATAAHPFSILFDLDDPDLPLALEELLPPIKKPVCVNGFSQPGADECKRTILVEIQVQVEIDSLFEFTPTAFGSTVKGLSIGGFLGSALIVNSSCMRIAGNNFGVRKDGITLYSPISQKQIEITSGTCIAIGGLEPKDKNLIANTTLNAIQINATGVTVVGNFIGTDVSGTKALSTSGVGISLQGNNNFIGCVASGGRNLISANRVAGINIEGNGNRVVNNFIGTDVNGKFATEMGNGDGILIIGGGNNLIAKSIIAQSSRDNIRINGSGFNTVRKCFIGTDITGKLSAPGTACGVLIEQSSNNLIEHSLISIRGGVGVQASNSCCNQILDNLIGTDINGKCALGQDNGIILCSVECSDEVDPIDCFDGPGGTICFGNRVIKERDDTPNGILRQCISACSEELCPLLDACTIPLSSFSSAKNLIKGNLISGNNCSGIILRRARKNRIENNTIGTDRKEKCTIPNTFGIVIGTSSESNRVLCNVIAGNSLYGIVVGEPRIGQQLSRMSAGNRLSVKKSHRQIVAVPFKNTFLKNSIFCNGESGIILINNGNRCITEPVITSATFDHNTNTLHAEGEFDCSCFPGQNIIIELYGNICCRKGIREGACFLASQIVACPSTTVPEEEIFVLAEREVRGQKTRQCEECVPFSFDVCIPDFVFQCVTATATLVNPQECNALEDTSAFSCPVPVLEPLEV